MKIVYNACHGGFSVSEAGVLRYAEIKGFRVWVERGKHRWDVTYWLVPPEERVKLLDDAEWHAASQEERIAHNQTYAKQTRCERRFERHDPALVQVVEELGKESWGEHAELRIKDVPAGSRYRIDEHDGAESVMTVDDYEWSVAE